MKKFISLLVLVFSLSAQVAFADVIPMGQNYIPGCAILKNTSAFPSVKFIAVFYEGAFYLPKPDKISKITVLDDSTCLHSLLKGEKVSLFAINTAKYETNAKNPDYNPENDLQAYPLSSAFYSTDKLLDASNKNNYFYTTDELVDISSKDTYFHREYTIQGFDNSKKVMIIQHVADISDYSKNDFPVKTVPANVENTMKLDTPIFKDVKVDSLYAMAVLNLKRKDMIQGYADGTYKPENLINRAEFVKIIMSDYSRTYDCSKQIFKDVSPLATNWYRNAVCWAYGEHGFQMNERVISGYADGTFRPDQNINFAEAAKIILNSKQVSLEGKTEPWYKQYISVFEKIQSVPSTIKSPDQKITRGEMALLMYSLDQHINEL